MIEKHFDPILVGRISGLYGVRGWVKVFSDTDPRHNILGYNPWYVKRQGTWQAITLLEGRPHGKGIIAHLEGYDDRDAAATLLGQEIAIERQQLAPAEAGEYYWIDLIGLEVTNRQGCHLGTITDLMETGANDVLVVQGERERLIPFVKDEIVLEVDLSAKRMRVDWPEDF